MRAAQCRSRPCIKGHIVKAFLLLAGTALAFSTPLAAQTVNETAGPNGTQATAQDLSGTFGLTASPDIQDSTTIPHVTVISGTVSESEFDYYSFTVATAGTTGIFDIDFGFVDSLNGPQTNFDPFLSVLDSAGNILAQNDDASTALGAGGSFHAFDSFISYLFPSAGTFAVRVGSCCEFAANGTYQLQVSLEAPGVTGAVPEPGTWAMMLLGFGAIGVSIRRRRKLTATPQLA